MHKPTLRVIEVLDLLCKSGAPMRLSDIGRQLDMPKSTLLPILQTMVEHRYISKDVSERYAPGYGLMELGSAARAVYSPAEHIREALKQLVDRFEETCYYGVLEGGSVLYLEKTESPQPIRMLTAIGRRLPAYATGIGKALLMDMSLQQLKSLYTEPMEPLTRNTITDVDILYRQLQHFRQLGYAWEEEESTEHIRCFAAPVRVDGEIVGAVSMAIPIFRFREEEQSAITDSLRNTASKIEQGLKLLS